MIFKVPSNPDHSMILDGQGKRDLRAVTTLCTVKRSFSKSGSSAGASAASPPASLPPPAPTVPGGCKPHQPPAQSASHRAVEPADPAVPRAGSAEEPSAAFIHQPVNTAVQALLQVWFSHRRCGGCSFPAGVGQAAGGCNCFSHPTLIHLCS